MPYVIQARYYSGADNTGETYVITSDNKDKDTRHEVGSKLMIIPMGEVEEVKSEVKSEVKLEVKSDVAKAFDSNPSEPYEEQSTAGIVTHQGVKVDLSKPPIDMTEEDVRRLPFEFPRNCSACPIGKTCPPFITYTSPDCQSELSVYNQNRAKKDKP